MIAALADGNLALILIDEPEMSIHPRLQRMVRDLLIERAEGRAVVVATHSHLFVDRHRPESIVMVENRSGTTITRRASHASDVAVMAFDLLGNSLEDLYLPANFLVVEGASDQRLAEAVRDLLGFREDKLKVLASAGITKMAGTVGAIETALRPLVTSDSPYAKRVVALMDRVPADVDATELRRLMRDRLIALGQDSLEEYIPGPLYEQAGLDKAEQLKRLQEARGPMERAAIKAEVSESVASALRREDLELVDELASAVRLALHYAGVILPEQVGDLSE
jgi:energy-coupling factor transporter ATP-binding protein EcfA2